MNRRAQLGMYIVWFFVASIIVVTAAVLVPAGVRFNTALYAAGEGILEDSASSINSIRDADVRASINASVVQAKQATTDNIDVLTAIYEYGPYIVLIISGLMFFLYSRRVVEYGQGGFI